MEMIEKGIGIVFEDNHLLVVQKPPGILSQSDITGDPDMLTQLKQYLVTKYQKPGEAYLGLVHRLDRPVGGIMVFAKTSKAASRLSEQIRNHNVQKTYLAVVNGVPNEKSATLSGLIQKDAGNNMVTYHEKPLEGIYNIKMMKDAKLYYNTLTEKEGLALLKIQLITGRSHQIRVSLASLGNPILYDVKYGNPHQKGDIALWAHSFAFLHPTSKERMELRVFPPKKTPWKMFSTYFQEGRVEG